jgi:hypothetical protein
LTAYPLEEDLLITTAAEDTSIDGVSAVREFIEIDQQQEERDRSTAERSINSTGSSKR